MAPARGEAALAVRRYDPARFLQGLVATAWRRAEERGQAVHIQGPWPVIAVYPTSYAAVVYGGEGGLRPYAGTEDLPTQATLVFSRSPQYAVNHPDMVPLDVLLWKLALSASRGRLPLDASLDTPFALREWPNFTRLIVTPGAMSVAALWVRQPSTLRQTIDLLHLPPEDVFVFYSAAAAVDLVRPDLPSRPASLLAAAPPSPPPAVVPTPRRPLLRKLFDKLRTG
ncbi:hypothetical protein [Pseudofrankia inefficax]|uniref:hypothetical protein n=1 Tax=Pseudofrankia inefficax (strain DSM 45817 / CECT 9037 / DDB 130130 / EuI1c) TaxID=298654 RepID=UPI000305FCF1|nr:hypothetical protein [Pseudofrankia inefficax]